MSRVGKGAGEHGEKDAIEHAEVAENTETRSRLEGDPGLEGPRGPGPPAAGRQEALPAAASERRKRRGKGCLKSVEFPREKQRLHSVNSEAEDALLEDWGSWRAKGGREREGSPGAGEGCGERESETPSRRGGEARWDDMQELRVWGRSCCHSAGAQESSAETP